MYHALILAGQRDLLVEQRAQRGLLRRLMRKLDTILQEIPNMAKTIQDYATELQTAMAENTAAIAAQSTVIGSVQALVEGEVATIDALQKQLADALAAGGSAEVLQPIVEAFGAHITTLKGNTQRLVDSVLINTPASGERRA